MMDFELPENQQECKYGKEVALIIIEPLQLIDLYSSGYNDDRGIWWPREVYLPPDDDIKWTPLWELEDTPNSPDPLSNPALPFPFTARELAAYMVGDIGNSLLKCYLNESGNLSEEILNDFGQRGIHVRKALRESFNLYHAAESKVGSRPESLHQISYAAWRKYDDAYEGAKEREKPQEQNISKEESDRRYDRIHLTVAHLKSECENTKKQYIEAIHKWRKAMVLELLAPNSSKQQNEPTRRLAALKALGGSITWTGGEPSFKKTNELIAKEKNEGRKRTSPKTIRGDLRIAALAERKAQREGLSPASPMPR